MIVGPANRTIPRFFGPKWREIGFRLPLGRIDGDCFFSIPTVAAHTEKFDPPPLAGLIQSRRGHPQLHRREGGRHGPILFLSEPPPSLELIAFLCRKLPFFHVPKFNRFLASRKYRHHGGYSAKRREEAWEWGMRRGLSADDPDPAATPNDSGAVARVASSSSLAKRGPGVDFTAVNAGRSARLQGVSPPDLRGRGSSFRSDSRREAL